MEAFKVFPNNASVEKWFSSIRWTNKKQRPHFLRHALSLAPPSCAVLPQRLREIFFVRTCTVMPFSKLGYKVWADGFQRPRWGSDS